MTGMRIGHSSWRALTCALLLFVCPMGAAAQDAAFRIAQSFEAKGHRIPYTLYLKLSPASPTRMNADAFIDLRNLQRNLPGLLSQVIDETCKHRYAVAIADTRAAGRSVTVSGQLQAKFWTCNDKDPATHYRGLLLLAQNVDFTATASARVRRNCVELQLTDVQIDPGGLLGSVADLFGLTERARQIILEKGAEVLARNPICPKLPPDLAVLSPRFVSGGTQEIGDGGIGATLGGSVDTSAATMIALLQAMKRRGLADD
ncbi:hypothetical protein ACFORG_00100 [Lutimaribacter marinistellae]|uniref:Uncharacterized protein n=1 Tax=Lutimaribacter marinistellae TaxID=1820329 RepID=A0ABV7TDP6_9RHOB